MRNYEVIFIIHPDQDEAGVESLIEKVKGWITGAEGTVEKAELWGKRRLAYPINKQREGQYVYMVVAFPASFSTELDRNMRLTEPIMRYMITAK
jgi:small subunit ribosomal protein S6